MKQYTLPKRERLYLRESIGELFAKGRSFTVFPYRVVYLIKRDAEIEVQLSAQKQARCAMMAVAPKKRFKHAVDRNHVKRLTREAYRLQKLPLWAVLKEKRMRMEVSFLYMDSKFLTFDETRATIGRALNKLTKAVVTEEEGQSSDDAQRMNGAKSSGNKKKTGV